MFVMIRTIGAENLQPDDPVVLRYDAAMGRIGAFDIDGSVYGYLHERQPSGCVACETLYGAIGSRRILARAAVIADGMLLLSFSTPLAAPMRQYVRVERAGYGILVHS